MTPQSRHCHASAAWNDFVSQVIEKWILPGPSELDGLRQGQTNPGAALWKCLKAPGLAWWVEIRPDSHSVWIVFCAAGISLEVEALSFLAQGRRFFWDPKLFKRWQRDWKTNRQARIDCRVLGCCCGIFGELCSPKRYVEVQTPGTCECNLTGKSLCRYSHARMRSYWIRMGPNPMTGVFRRREFGHRDTDTQGERHVTTEGEIRGMSLQARECQGLPAVARRKRQGRTLPCSLQSQHSPADNWISTSSLQACERINFCFESPSLWWLVTAVLGN